MRPLHLVPRNVPGEGGGGSGGGKEDREGETVWKFVALASCRAGFLFSWRSKMGAEGLATRPADASSGEGGREASSESQVTGLSLPNPAFFSAFPPPCWAQDHQRSEKDLEGLPATRHHPPATSWEGQVQDRDIWPPWRPGPYKSLSSTCPVCQGLQSAQVTWHFG